MQGEGCQHHARDDSPGGTDAGVAISSGARWRGVAAAVRRQPPPPLLELYNDWHVVALHLGRPHHVAQHRDGQRRAAVRRRGDLLLDPARQPVAYDWTQPADAFILRLDPALVERVAADAPGRDPGRFELLPLLCGRDAQLERVLLAFLGELRADGLGGRLYAEALATTLAVHLVRRHSSLGTATGRVGELPRGALSRTAGEHVREYIEAHLDRDLALAELAALVGLSPRHFARLFHAATGQPPHRYVIGRRVERARALLATTDLPLADIAAAVGFADRSHLAAHFRRLVGMAPADFRRESGRNFPDPVRDVLASGGLGQ
jgi:AraC family transcriptional regulator